MEMEATVGDELRWFHVLARALWSGPSDPVYLGSIGKLIDIDDRQAELIDLQFKAYHDPLTEVVNGAFARKIIAERLGSGEACDRHRDRHVLARSACRKACAARTSWPAWGAMSSSCAWNAPSTRVR